MANGSRSPRVRRTELEKFYNDFRAMKYPPTNGQEEIGRLNDLLILYDADVAAAATRVLGGTLPVPELRDLSGLQENKELEGEIDRLLVAYQVDHYVGRAARQYSIYYDMIKKVITAAKSYLESIQSWPKCEACKSGIGEPWENFVKSLDGASRRLLLKGFLTWRKRQIAYYLAGCDQHWDEASDRQDFIWVMMSGPDNIFATRKMTPNQWLESRIEGRKRLREERAEESQKT